MLDNDTTNLTQRTKAMRVTFETDNGVAFTMEVPTYNNPQTCATKKGKERTWEDESTLDEIAEIVGCPDEDDLLDYLRANWDKVARAKVLMEHHDSTEMELTRIKAHVKNLASQQQAADAALKQYKTATDYAQKEAELIIQVLSRLKASPSISDAIARAGEILRVLAGQSPEQSVQLPDEEVEEKGL